MTNKKLISDMFEQKLSADRNYQAILSKLDKKKEQSSFRFWKWSLVPTFVLMLMVLNLISASENDININSVKPTVAFRMNVYDTIEINIQEYYSFVKDIKVPGCMKREDSAYSIDGEIHDYIINYSSEEKSLKISFTEVGVESLIDRIDITNMKTSTVSEVEVIIALLDAGRTYYAIFEYRGLDFWVETSGMTLNELIDVLESILI